VGQLHWPLDERSGPEKIAGFRVIEPHFRSLEILQKIIAEIAVGPRPDGLTNPTEIEDGDIEPGTSQRSHA
jgi:hypothetical protein